MTLWNRFGSWLRATLRRSRMENEMDAELRFHLQEYAEDLIRSGVPRREALRRAHLEFGGIERAKEECRDARGAHHVENLIQDLRYGVRILRKSPGFTAVAVLTLALGIGMNTAVFSVVNAVLLRPLPFPQPDQLFQLAQRYKEQTDEAGVDYKQFKQLQEYGDLFHGIAGYTEVGYNMAAGTGADHLRGMPVSANYFQVLGVRPVLGRDFLAEDDRGAGQRVAIVSHALWMRRFAADSSEMGQTVLLNGEPFIIIGVMPRDFDSLGLSGAPDPGSPDIWTPLALVEKTAGSGGNISVLARLKPGVTRAQLDAQMRIVTQDLSRGYARDSSGQVSLTFLPYQLMVSADVRPYLFLLFGAIAFVLLIACANVANLLLARGGSRAREIAVRRAIGASRSQLFQQLLTESILISIAGGAIGLLLANFGLSSLLAIAPVDLPRAPDAHLDGWVLAFTFLVSLLTGVLFGLAPALDAFRANVSESLKEGVGRSSTARGSARLRRLLIVGEFAISLVLLSGAGLMIATFSKLLHADAGFDPHRVLSMQIWLIGSKYNSTAQIETFNRAVVQRLETLPGVEAAGIIAAGLPLERGGNNGVQIPGPNSSQTYSTDYREITPGYFRAMGIPLKQGRAFLDSDSENSAKVAIVNEAFAREHFSGRSAVGQQIFLGDTASEIVGVAGDVKSYLDQPAPPTTFVPSAQASYGTSSVFEGWFARNVTVRASVDPPSLSRAVREAIVAVDPMIPTGQTRSMDQVLSRSLALRSFMMTLLSLFAALALLLASVGIYGVSSYVVSQRTREIGVRMAIGARPRDVLRLVLTEGLKLVLVGVAIGIAAAVALTRLLATLLYGVTATDPFVLFWVTVILVAVSLAACYIPARRAMRVDPVVALRYE
jgi:putative ABC transport system permease protein